MFSLCEQKCAPGCLMKNELWGWKIWWQMNCAGTVHLVNGVCVPGASSGRSAKKPPGNQKCSNYLGM